MVKQTEHWRYGGWSIGVSSTMRNFALLAIFSGLISFPTHAANPWTGVWRGTLGNSKITACFNSDDSGEPFYGSYYYDRHRKPINLSKEAKNQDWKEFARDPKVTSTWALNVPAGNTLVGQWSKVGGKEVLPIKLARVPPTEAKETSKKNEEFTKECASEAFNLPLEISPQVVVGEPKEFEGKRYRIQSVSVDTVDGGDSLSIATIELLEQGTTIDEVNRQLLNVLPRTKEKMQETLYWCRRNALGRFGEDGQSGGRVEPIFWTDRWLGVAEYSSDNCGGAYPSAGISYQTWDLTTGKKANLWTWIKNSKKKGSDPKQNEYYFNYSAPEKLNDIIVKKAIRNSKKWRGKNDSDCLEPLESNNEYKLRLTKTGIVFSTSFPHVIQACDEDVEITYRQLQPFLTQTGEAQVKYLIEGVLNAPNTDTSLK